MTIPRAAIDSIYNDCYDMAAAIVQQGEEHAMICLRGKVTPQGFALIDSALLGGDKERIGKLLRAYRAECGVHDVCVFISEAWSRLLAPGEHPDLNRPVAEQPGAVEVIMFHLFGARFDLRASCLIDKTSTPWRLLRGELEDASQDQGRFAVSPQANP